MKTDLIVKSYEYHHDRHRLDRVQWSTRSMPAIMLLQLPPELRHCIYTSVFEDEELTIETRAIDRSAPAETGQILSTRPCPGVLLVSKRVYREALAVRQQKVPVNLPVDDIMMGRLSFGKTQSQSDDEVSTLCRRRAVSIRGFNSFVVRFDVFFLISSSCRKEILLGRDYPKDYLDRVGNLIKFVNGLRLDSAGERQQPARLRLLVSDYILWLVKNWQTSARSIPLYRVVELLRKSDLTLKQAEWGYFCYCERGGYSNDGCPMQGLHGSYSQADMLESMLAFYSKYECPSSTRPCCEVGRRARGCAGQYRV